MSAARSYPRPAIDRARHYLLDLIERIAKTPQKQLPSLGELSRGAHISRTTMWKAVNNLKSEGILNVIGGGKISLASLSNDVAPDTMANLKIWETKRDALGNDIIQGRYDAGSRLPSFMELASRYGVSKNTLKKMVDSLYEKGVLSIQNRHWIVPALTKKRFQSTIVVVSEPLSLFHYAPNVIERMQKLFHALEAECTIAGLSLAFVDLDLPNPERHTRALRAFKDDDSVIGYIMNTWWWAPEDRFSRVLDAIGLMATHEKPIAIMDQTGEMAWVPGFLPLDRARVFRAAGFSAGQEVARHLVKHGHRHVAFISMMHRHGWSRNRLMGMKDVFDTVNLRGHIAEICDEEFLDILDPLYGVFDGSDPAIKQVVSFADSEANNRIARSKEIRSREMKPGSDAKRVRQVKTDFRALKGLLDYKMSAETFIGIRWSLYMKLGEKALDGFAEPFFDRALAEPNVTAWVGSNDEIALSALRYLESKGGRLKRTISVVGFDNCMSAFERKLTSYEFDMAAIAHRMLTFVVRPKDAMNAPKQEVIEVDGYVIERSTTLRRFDTSTGSVHRSAQRPLRSVQARR